MISVVVPTLGKCDLNILINQLNAGTLKPKEILICIPHNYKNNIKLYYDKNVKIIYTSNKGQVIQRIYGFKNCTCNYVLQLDDDVILEENSIKLLYDKLIELGDKNVVGPLYYDLNHNYLHKQKTQYKQLIEDIYTYLIKKSHFGIKKMGTITASGYCYNIDPEYYNDSVIYTSWLPGGCVLSHKDDLIIEDYYPFEGKAYCEDIINSLLRIDKKINHYVIADAKVYITDYSRPPFTLDLLNEFNIRYYISYKLLKNNIISSICPIIFDIIKLAFYALIRKICKVS